MRSANTAVATPMGRLMKKIQCQSDRAAGRGDERVDADRLGLLPRLGEQRDDHAEDHRGRQRTADALGEPGDDERLLAVRQSAGQRGGGEDRETRQEDAAA
jgi:hypothetical protein